MKKLALTWSEEELPCNLSPLYGAESKASDGANMKRNLMEIMKNICY